jgi:hypothetical protein
LQQQVLLLQLYRLLLLLQQLQQVLLRLQQLRQHLPSLHEYGSCAHMLRQHTVAWC